jgi:histidine triad (HIT) family protein
MLARTAVFGALLRKGFAHMSFLIPLARLRETPALVAFHHPSPSYPVHVLIVPKRSYRSLLDLPAGDTQFLQDLIETVAGLVRELGLEQRGYRLITNGGPYQDVPVLHFHLISEAR